MDKTFQKINQKVLFIQYKKLYPHFLKNKQKTHTLHKNARTSLKSSFAPIQLAQ